MCWCDKNLRTPCCGSVKCVPPVVIDQETILANSTLALWTSYTDKKQECEILREMLAECMQQCEYLLKTPPEEVWKSKVTDKLINYTIYLQKGVKEK